jgi:hypothetical protein
MKTLGLIELTMAAGVSLMLSTPVWAHDWDRGNSGSERTYHYSVSGYQNGGSGFGLRTSAGSGVDNRSGYSGPNTSISRPHRAAWNAYIRNQANRDALQEATARPDCGFNRSPMDCRVMPYYETVVTVR